MNLANSSVRRGGITLLIDLAKAEEMVVLCHSPVQADDPEQCGEARLPANISAEDCAEVYKNPWDSLRLEGEEFLRSTKSARLLEWPDWI